MKARLRWRREAQHVADDCAASGSTPAAAPMSTPMAPSRPSSASSSPSADGSAGGSASACTVHPMTAAQLGAVMAIEASAYAFPWSRGNFVDSLAAGYAARLLCSAGGEVLGYFVAMAGVDEMHLLNITVAPAVQGRGHARRLIAELVQLCRDRAAGRLWLEVRAGNAHARAIYRHLGFHEAGLRRGYYPAPLGRREDAVVMSLRVGIDAPGGTGAGDALE